MTTGNSNVSKYKKTYNVAWSPPPPEEKKKTESLIQRLKRQKREKEKAINDLNDI